MKSIQSPLMMRIVQAVRYALALREGGSLPAIVEADDMGLYVVKFRGAGQGVQALVAELIAGEIGRTLGLRVPELALAEVDATLGRNEPDSEIRHLLKASVGLNLALDYLPGSTMFDGAAGDAAAPDVASMAVWFDAFVQNVDRTARNPNLLVWHGELYFIDHGAALFFHHDWKTADAKVDSPFRQTQDHVLLRWAGALDRAAGKAHELLTAATISRILSLVPEEWLESESISADDRRGAYLEYLTRRLDASANFEEEAARAYQRLL